MHCEIVHNTSRVFLHELIVQKPRDRQTQKRLSVSWLVNTDAVLMHPKVPVSDAEPTMQSCCLWQQRA